MSKKERVNTYTQCLLTREENVNGSVVNWTQISWIPTQYSKLGRLIEVKNRKTQEWEDSWKVTEKYNTRKAEDIEEHENDYKYQRKGSDI